MSKRASAQGLTALTPIKNGVLDGYSYSTHTLKYLQEMPLNEHSLMAKVPNTYFSRFYVLNDVFYQGSPADEEHLKSKYLVFTSNFYGDLDDYLTAMWRSTNGEVRDIWQHCVAFDKVNDAGGFSRYLQQCKVRNQLFFVGANNEPLAEQLKALYLKQAFSRFVFEHQALASQGAAGAAKLQQAFREFIKTTEPANLEKPTWVAGACSEVVNDAVPVGSVADAVGRSSAKSGAGTKPQATKPGLDKAV